MAGELPEVIHRIPGRLRLRLRPEWCTRAHRHSIETALRAEPDVLAHRISPDARSLVVEHRRGASTMKVRRLIAQAPPAGRPPASEPSRPRSRLPSLVALTAGSLLALAGQPLALPLIGAGAVPIFKRAGRGLAEGRMSVDALDSAALAISLATGNWVSAALVGGLVEGGELLRDLTASRSRRALGALMAPAGSTCWKLDDGHRRLVPVSSIRAGDRISLSGGDRVPVDGEVISGSAMLDERVLTGEPLPSLRTAGNRIFAMSVVTEGEVEIRATGTAAESRAGRIMGFLERSPIGETRMADHARRVGDRFVLPVMGLAAVTYALTRSPARAASILVFDVASGIRVAAPTTMLASLLAAARDGVLIKGAAAMEKLARVDSVIFDKTGTLTAGRPVVRQVASFNGMTPEEVLAVATGADHGLNHPFATALVLEATARQIDFPRRLSSSYYVGRGVEAQLEDGHTYLVGNRGFLADHGIEVPRPDHRPGSSEMFVAAGTECLGVVYLEDEARDQAAPVLAALRRRGVRRLALLSGDTNAATRDLAGRLGIEEWTARVSPEDKADFVRRLKGNGHVVAVVGDGVNDSLALQLADLSVAMGEGAEVAQAVADVILLEDRLELLPLALDHARGALGLMNQNLALIAAPNALGLGGALAININPAVAALVSNGSAVVAAANGLRPLLRGRRA